MKEETRTHEQIYAQFITWILAAMVNQTALLREAIVSKCRWKAVLSVSQSVPDSNNNIKDRPSDGKEVSLVNKISKLLFPYNNFLAKNKLVNVSVAEAVNDLLHPWVFPSYIKPPKAWQITRATIIFSNCIR